MSRLKSQEQSVISCGGNHEDCGGVVRRTYGTAYLTRAIRLTYVSDARPSLTGCRPVLHLCQLSVIKIKIHDLTHITFLTSQIVWALLAGGLPSPAVSGKWPERSGFGTNQMTSELTPLALGFGGSDGRSDRRRGGQKFHRTLPIPVFFYRTCKG